MGDVVDLKPAPCSMSIFAPRKSLERFGLSITTLWCYGYQLSAADHRKAMELILDKLQPERSSACSFCAAINYEAGQREEAMPNFKFDVDRVTEQLNRILQMELAGVIYYTHYSFMIYGHARIPITQWLRENATESLAHAQEAGQMIMRLHKRPDLGIAKLPTTRHNTIDQILADL